MADYIETIAVRLLDMMPEIVPAYKINKHLVGYSSNSGELEQMRQMVYETEQVQVLLRQQSAIGSWGKRFFTRNKNVKNPARTTETALIRLNALEIDREAEVFQRSVEYMEKLLDGRLRWPDQLDSSLQHDEAMRLVIVTRLSQIRPEHPYVKDYIEKIKQIMNAAFAPGFFDEAILLEASEDILRHRLTTDRQICFSLYPLILLRDQLDFELQQLWIEHLFKHRRGIYLVNNRSLQHLPLSFPSEESMRYINAVELLSWYPAAVSYLEDARDWLWEQENNEGLWDLGSYGRDGLELPLSRSWRNPVSRHIDSSVRILMILHRLQLTCSLRDTVCHFL